jgi:hypothetical protein
MTVARAADAGADTDPDLPWIASCETHGTMIASASRRLARIDARAPTEWCDECRETAARVRLVELANEAGRRAGRGAPGLAADSAAETIAQWLQTNDPNGVHTAELAARDGIDPYTPDAAWRALAQVLIEEDDEA